MSQIDVGSRAQARDELQQPPAGRERPAWMDTPGQTHQSLPAPAPPQPAAQEDAVSSRLAALKARLAAEKSKSSSRQHEHRRRVVLTVATGTSSCADITFLRQTIQTMRQRQLRSVCAQAHWNIGSGGA